jgi:hypothetical protein
MNLGLKFTGKHPIRTMGMVRSFSCFVSVCAAALLAVGMDASAAGRKAAKPLPIVSPEPKKEQTLAPPAPPSADAGKAGAAFAELSMGRTLVIEGKVEKPQVSFTLLKEPPPEKEIRFETSFLENILKLDRENTFVPGETYGRE